MRKQSAKTVFITGAEGALGSKVAEKFSLLNYRVIGTHHSSQKNHLPPILGIQWLELDLTDSKAVNAKIQSLNEIDREIHCLIHCAGGFRYSPVDQIDNEDLDFLIDTNLRSAFFLARALLPGMKERNFGRIVFISAKATLQPSAGMGPYAASKSGLNMLTSALADEVRSFDINVNAVLPSIIDTPANRRDMPKADFSKWVSTAALAEIIFSLTQPWGDPIHGALIPVSGRL